MKQPLVSVFIPCYNTEKYIEEAVRSVMTQTYKNLEIIIIDDGSTDRSYDVLLSLSKEDKRIQLFKNEENLRLPKTRNKGIKMCSGRYIALMDADDICIPTRIEKQVAFLQENKEIGVLGGAVTVLKGNKQIKVKTHLLNKQNINQIMLYTYALWNSTVMFNTEVVKKEWIKYDERFYVAQDHNLWVDLIINYNIPFINLKDMLGYYRVLKTSVTRISSKNYLEREKIVSIMYRKLFAFNKIQITDAELSNFIKLVQGIGRENINIKLLKHTLFKIKKIIGITSHKYIGQIWCGQSRRLLKLRIKEGLPMIFSRLFWIGFYNYILRKLFNKRF